MLTARTDVNTMHWDISQKVHIMEPDMSIMPVMEQANIVVSEEYRSLIRTLPLTNPAVYVSDVKITDTCLSPFAFLQHTKHAWQHAIRRSFQEVPE